MFGLLAMLGCADLGSDEGRIRQRKLKMANANETYEKQNSFPNRKPHRIAARMRKMWGQGGPKIDLTLDWIKAIES